MHTQRLPLRLFVLSLGVALVTGCASTPAASPLLGSPSRVLSGLQQPLESGPVAQFRNPALIAVNSRTAELESWPISPVGGNNPHAFTGPLGLSGSNAIAADGRVLAITSDYPPQVIIYNINTKHERKLGDPFGTPVDIAIDKNEALYALNIASPLSNVAMYAPGSSNPTELTCAQLQTGEAIAVDKEGNVFINGYTKANGAGVVEIPHGSSGPQSCKVLKNLNSEPGYVAGVAIDPKTDDLVVLDDPDLCAGGIEGRMTIYRKPYSKQTGKSVVIGQNCTGAMRLNADSSTVYAADQDISGSYSFILQRSYPGGQPMGAYFGGSEGGFATIPNTLPN